jgi:cyanate permease
MPRPNLLAIYSVGTGVVINLLARTGAPLCRPDALAQGHAAWHVLTAVGLAAWLVRWEERAVMPSSKTTESRPHVE